MKTIGFITDLYHSEVLDFLFNLYDSQNVKFVWYHNIDWHGNRIIYQEKYKDRLIIKRIDECLWDLSNKSCELFYFAEFEFLIKLKNIPEVMKQSIILVAHSRKQCDMIKEAGMKYITLTPILCDKNQCNYMIPITYESSIDLNQVKKIQHEKRKYNGKKLSIAMIGLFNNDIRDISEITKVANDDVNLYIFTRMITKELYEFYHQNVTLANKSNIHIILNLPTQQILDTIALFNIECVIFLPSKNYNVYSGSIHFAYNNNIPLLTTAEVKQIYNLEGALEINNSEMIDAYKGGGLVDSLVDAMDKYRKATFKRNTIVNYLIQKGVSLQMTVFTQNEMEIKKNGGITICVGIGDGLAILKIMCYVNGDFVLIERNTDKAKAMKNKLITLDLIDRCIIYNNIANDCNIENLKDDVDAICLDTLMSDKQIDNIYINVNEEKNVLLGAKGILNKYNPTVILNL